MKNTFYLLCLILFISCHHKKESYIIKARLSNISSGKAYLEYADYKDSCKIKNGSFRFKGKLQRPQICKINISEPGKEIQFYLENSVISIQGDAQDLDKAMIKGSKTENERIAYNKMLTTLDPKIEALEREYRQSDLKRRLEIEDQLEVMIADLKKEFIRKNPSSFLCITFLQDIDWSFTTAKEYKKYLTLLHPALNQYEELQHLKEMVTRMEKVDIGQKAIDFEIKDSKSNCIKLSDQYVQSNYLLLDFWASSCKTCRIENRHIRELYHKYHKEGFEVVGVSTDTKKDRWLKAIRKDELPWINTCNLKKWKENELVDFYVLRQQSANFLIDNSGTIIAKDLRGEELSTKLTELFEKPD